MRFLGETRLPDAPVLIAPRKTLSLEGFSADRAARKSAWENLWTSTDRLQSLRDNFNSEGRAIEEARQNRRKAILDATGEDIAKISHEEYRALTRASDPNAAIEDITAKEYQRRLSDLAARYPDKLDAIRPNVSLEQDAYALAQGAETDAAAARAAADKSGLRAPAKFGAALGGGFQGALRDPLQVGTLLVGGGASTARTLFGRIVQTMFTEAIINGGVEAAVQVSANDWKRRAGLDASLGTSLEQVGLATLFGGAFGGLLEGGRAAVKALGADVAPDVLERAVAGDAGAVRAVAAAMGQKVDAKALDLAVEQDGLDNAAFGPQLQGAPKNTQLANKVIDAIENDTPLPELPQPVRPMLSPENFRFFDPAQLQVDAAQFQFKAGGDGAGVTERLRGVESWNPERAGVVVVFEDQAGRQFIADGHQRTALAQRVSAATGEKISIPGYVFRAADGWTAEDVRVAAALKNIGEGSGTAIDAAKVLRTGISVRQANLPPSSALVRDAAGLARLSDDAFTMAVNEVVKPQLAAVVGRINGNRALDAQMLQVLKEQGAKTIADAESMVRDLLSQATFTERQDSLFGAEEVTRMLLKERAAVRSAAMNALKKDRQVFAMLAEEEARVTGAGNILDSAANKDRANEDAILIDLIEKLVNRTGAIADAFNAAARSVAGGTSAGAASRAFVDAVRTEIERSGGDLGAIGRNGPGAGEALLISPEQLAPASAVEPASKEAGDLAALALVEARGGTVQELEASGQANMFGAASTKEKLDAQAAKPLRGGDAAAGGLFDETVTKQMDIADLIPAGKDADGNDLHVSHAQLIEDADRDDFFGDLIASCKE